MIEETLEKQKKSKTRPTVKIKTQQVKNESILVIVKQIPKFDVITLVQKYKRYLPHTELKLLCL